MLFAKGRSTNLIDGTRYRPEGRVTAAAPAQGATANTEIGSLNSIPNKSPAVGRLSNAYATKAPKTNKESTLDRSATTASGDPGLRPIADCSVYSRLQMIIQYGEIPKW